MGGQRRVIGTEKVNNSNSGNYRQKGVVEEGDRGWQGKVE